MKKTKNILLIVLSILLLASCSNDRSIFNNEQREQDINKIETEENIKNIEEEWIVDNEWKLNINKIYEAEERNHYANKKENQTQFINKNPIKVLKIQYTYENLNPESNNLLIIPYKIVTNNNEIAYQYPLYEINHPIEIDYNEACENAESAFGFDKEAESIKIYFKGRNSGNDNVEEIIYEYNLK